MRIHTTAKLSEHIDLTPEGYLYCRGVALARTGVMEYLRDEVPPEMTAGFDGDTVLVVRDEEDVFSPVTLASFEGKPFTLDHPEDDVCPDNWNELAQGVVMSVRRGEGRAHDLMLADILITGAEAIAAVREGGLRELSCGYDADFVCLRPGVGRQTHIMGNHVALVARGRAGGRCKIYDQKEHGMTTQAKAPAKGASLKDKLLRLLRDEEAAPPHGENSGAESAPTTDDDIAAGLEEIKLMLRTLLEALKPAPADEEPAADADPAADNGGSEEGEEPAADDDPAADEDPAADNEEKNGTADAAMVRNARRMGLLGCRQGDSADAVQRSALALACRDADTRRLVDGILGGRGISRAPRSTVQAAFMAVAAVSGVRNNHRTADALTGQEHSAPRQFTPAEINKLNAEFYGDKGGK